MPLDQTLIGGEICQFEDQFTKFTDKHAPLKSKQVRDTHTPFKKEERIKQCCNGLDWKINT